ncbi:MAG: DNA-binding response regulator [Micrococcaceae bacterium]|jgi:DNA-binding LytR/AlgR family response regulator|nr:DNA-binding response regulator [Micrococcaceae bacterium]
MIDVLIADDEQPALAELAFLLSRDERIGAVHQASSGSQALLSLETHAVDALFLDIHMPGLSGLQLARAVNERPRPPSIVFVTADEDCALAAFELAAVDYLLKPLRPERLTRSIGRLHNAVDSGQQAIRPTTITVDQGGVSRIIRRDEVRFVQAQGDYARLHTPEASYLVRVPLADLERQWADAGFLRVHRSYLVCLPAITQARLTAAQPTVTVSGANLPVSRRHLPLLREALSATRIRPHS